MADTCQCRVLPTSWHQRTHLAGSVCPGHTRSPGAAPTCQWKALVFCISSELGQSLFNQKLCKDLLWPIEGSEASQCLFTTSCSMIISLGFIVGSRAKARLTVATIQKSAPDVRDEPPGWGRGAGLSRPGPIKPGGSATRHQTRSSHRENALTGGKNPPKASLGSLIEFAPREGR